MESRRALALALISASRASSARKNVALPSALNHEGLWVADRKDPPGERGSARGEAMPPATDEMSEVDATIEM